jgi:transcriptional regulator with XRE-family HTH domain
MTPNEKQMSKALSRLVRATRVHRGFRQTDIAAALEISQSALSKVESGLLMLSAPQWITFCDFVGIQPSSLKDGFIDQGQTTELRGTKWEGGFKIPKRYRFERASKARTLHPFRTYFQTALGEAAWEKYLDSVGFDPAFFAVLDNQVNLEFNLDICRTLAQKGKLREAIPAMVRSLVGSQAHGVLHQQYATAHDSTDLIVRLVENLPRYEANFSYKVEDANPQSMDLSIAPEPHISAFKYRNDPVLGGFLCSYKKEYLKQFTESYQGKSWTVKEHDCHFKGDSKCVYRLHATA